LEELKSIRNRKIAELTEGNLDQDLIIQIIIKEWNKYFNAFDMWLDRQSTGPRYLKEPRLASVVYDSLIWMSQNVYELICFCIMPNHIHKIVITREEVLWRAMERHKRYTARECNRIMGRSGPFWQHESFDHLIRNEQWLIQKIRYTLKNPEVAGLVKSWKSWPYAYLNPLYESWLNQALEYPL
jgi:putative transposase